MPYQFQQSSCLFEIDVASAHILEGSKKKCLLAHNLIFISSASNYRIFVLRILTLYAVLIFLASQLRERWNLFAKAVILFNPCITVK